MLKQVTQRRQIRCNFCSQWCNSLQNNKNCINLCQVCIEKALKTNPKVVSPDGKETYSLSLVKRITKPQTEENQQNPMKQDKIDVQNNDELTISDNKKILLICEQIIHEICNNNNICYKQMEKYLRKLREKNINYRNQIQNLCDNQRNSSLYLKNYNKNQHKRKEGLDNIPTPIKSIDISFNQPEKKPPLRQVAHLKNLIDSPYLKIQMFDHPKNQKNKLDEKFETQRNFQEVSKKILSQQKEEQVKKMKILENIPLKRSIKSQQIEKVQSQININPKYISKTIPLQIMTQSVKVQNIVNHQSGCNTLKNSKVMPSTQIKNKKKYNFSKKQNPKSNSFLPNNSLVQVKSRLATLTTEVKIKDSHLGSINSLQNSMISSQKQQIEGIQSKLLPTPSPLDGLILLNSTEQSQKIVKINRNRHYDLQIVGNNRLKQKIYNFLQNDSQIIPSLYLMKTLQIYDAIQNTNSINRCIELIAYNIQQIDIKCYLSMLEWSGIDVLKLVKVGLSDEQFVQVIRFILDKKIQTLVASNNKLTEISVISLKFYNEKLIYLKNVYLGTNKIQKSKLKDLLQKIQQGCNFILYI